MSLSVVPLALALLPAQPPAAETSVTPKSHAVELGVYGGAFLTPAREGFTSNDGAPVSLDAAGLNFAFRMAYLPFTFLGVEAEAGHIAIDSQMQDDTELYTLRGHLLAQYPARLSPFLLMGAGAMGVTFADDEMGHDGHAVFHWGLGAKYFISDEVLVRLDGRHNLALEGDGLGHHFELLAGITFTVFGTR